MLKTALNYGAMSGLGCFAVFLILYFSGFNPLGNVSLIASWIPVVFICLSTKHFREHEMAGFIKYGEAWQIGMLTGICTGIVYSLIIYIFGTVIDHTIVESYKAEVYSQLEKSKELLNETLYQKGIESLDHTTISSIAFGDFITKSVWGAVVSLVTAAIYKKDPPLIQDENK